MPQKYKKMTNKKMCEFMLVVFEIQRMVELFSKYIYTI